MVGKVLNVFQGNALFQQGSDGGDPEGVGRKVAGKPSVANPPLEHALHVIIGHRIGRQLAFPGNGGAEDGGVLVVHGDSGGVEVAQEDLLQVVADGDFAVFAAFVVEGEDPLVAFASEILQPKPGDGPNPRARIGQDRQNRSVPNPHEGRATDGPEELLGVFDGDFWRFSFTDLVALIFNGADGVQNDGVPLDLEVKKVVQSRPMKLFGRNRQLFEAFEVIADIPRTDLL